MRTQHDDKKPPKQQHRNLQPTGDLSDSISRPFSPKEASHIQNIEDILFNNHLLSQLSQGGESPQNKANMSVVLSDFMMTQIDDAFGYGMDSPKFRVPPPDRSKFGFSGQQEALKLKLFKTKDDSQKQMKPLLKAVNTLQSDKYIRPKGVLDPMPVPDFSKDRAIQEVSERSEDASNRTQRKNRAQRSVSSSKQPPSEMLSPININRLPGLKSVSTPKGGMDNQQFKRFFDKRSNAHKTAVMAHDGDDNSVSNISEMSKISNMLKKAPLKTEGNLRNVPEQKSTFSIPKRIQTYMTVAAKLKQRVKREDMELESAYLH